MANYSVYNPNQAALDSSAQWRNEAYQRLQELGQRRQAWTNKMYAQQQAAQRAMEKEQLKTGYGAAAQGAAVGTMFAPGYGTVIGGAVGLGTGMLSEAQARRDYAKAHGKKDPGFWKALGKSIARVPSQNEIGQIAQAGLQTGMAYQGAQRQNKLDALYASSQPPLAQPNVYNEQGFGLQQQQAPLSDADYLLYDQAQEATPIAGEHYLNDYGIG